MKLRIPFTQYEIHIQLRHAAAATRRSDPLPEIIINQAERAATVAALDLDSIRERAAAMRAAYNS